MPFAWGSDRNDCVSFAAAAVAAQTGINPLGGLKWTDEASAYEALEAAGGIGEAVSSALVEIAPALAMRGDVGAIANGNGLILVIVEGDTLAGPGPRGLMRLPRRLMVKAWRAE